MKQRLHWTTAICACLLLLGCGNKNGPLVGDHLYIPDGYGRTLTSMRLKEVEAFPQFSYPFISVAQDNAGKQHAVEFWPKNKVVDKSLALTLNVIENRFQSLGVNDFEKAHLTIYETESGLVWSCQIGHNNMGGVYLYLDMDGNRVTDPWKKP